ncbi:MAG: SOUL family heme-binding protein [Hyphomicrobiaceae bacterium]
MRLRRLTMVVLGALAVFSFAYIVAALYIDNVEHPTYRTVVRDGDIEVRSYGPMVAAEVTMRGTRREAVNRGFSPLASYIFAKGRGGDAVAMTAPVTQVAREPIAMTAPVTQSRGVGDGEWTVRFLMPAKYSLASLPVPANQAVTLTKTDGVKRAVIRFTGRASDAKVATKEDELRAWVQERGLKVSGAATYAYYNSPFTPWFMRRNEIMLDLTKD